MRSPGPARTNFFLLTRQRYDRLPLFTYLIEALEFLDRIDRLLAAGARLAHLYLLFLLGEEDTSSGARTLSSSLVRVHKPHSRAPRLLDPRGYTHAVSAIAPPFLRVFETPTRGAVGTHARTTQDARTHTRTHAHNSDDAGSRVLHVRDVYIH